MHYSTRSLSRRRQQGFSLLELGIVLVIIAIIVIVVLARGASERNTASGSNESQDVIAVLGAATGLKSAGTYGAAGTDLVPSIVAENDAPGDWSHTTTTMTNNAGGPVTVVSNGNTFTLTSGNYPQQECIKVALAVSQSGSYTTAINGGTAINGPVSSAAATAGCNSATNNSIAFTSLN